MYLRACLLPSARRYGCTGVLTAITAAVAMRPPRAAWPVLDLETLVALPARGASGGTGETAVPCRAVAPLR